MTAAELFSIHSYHGYIIQILAAECLFIPWLKFRNKVWLRLLVAFPLFAVLSIITPNLLNAWVEGFTSFVIFLYTLALGFFLFKSRPTFLVFCFAGAQLIQNLAHNIEMLIYLPFSDSISNIGWLFISVATATVVYIFALLFLIMKRGGGAEDRIPSGGALTLVIFSSLFCYLFQFLLRAYDIDHEWITTIPLIFCDVFAIIFSFGLVTYMEKINENMELERVISHSQTFYDLAKSNLELVNMKAHDLKHFIAAAENSSSIDGEGLRELKKTVEDYESTAKTGNIALDTMLTNYLYICKNASIPFTLTVDGSAISFMTTGDLTSLFGNLLSNAVEAEKQLSEANGRYILLKMMERGEMVSIHLENYCPEKPRFRNGLPVSTKGDFNFHGFGTKSASYIVRKYGGNISFAWNEPSFEVDVLFPKQEAKKE